jgi:hypothetical protein
MLNAGLQEIVMRSARESPSLDWQRVGRDFVLAAINENPSSPDWFSKFNDLVDLRNAVAARPVAFTLKEVATRDGDKFIGATLERNLEINADNAYTALAGGAEAMCCIASALQKTFHFDLALKSDATGYAVVIRQQNAAESSGAQQYGYPAEFVEVPAYEGTFITPLAGAPHA